MVRTVTVNLKMDISDYEAHGKQAIATMGELGAEVKVTGDKTSAFSRLVTDNLRDGETAFESLTRKSTELRTEIDKLRGDFAQTGDKGIFGDLKSAQNDLKTIERFLGQMGPVGSQAGQQAGNSFLKSFVGSFSESTTLAESAGPVGIAFGVAIAAVATPVVVSALTAGVAGAIGAGILGAGALIQKNNPVIQAALDPLREDFTSTFKDATSPLQQGFEDAIRSADLFVTREGPALKAMFASVAPAITPITHGLESLVSGVIPQLTAIGNEFTKSLSNPAVHDALTTASADFTNLFKTIGNNPQVIAVGFETIGKAVSFVTGFMSGLINATDHVISGFDDVTKFVSKLGGSGENAQKQLQDPFTLIHQSFPQLAAEANGAQGILQTLGQNVSDVATRAERSATSFNVLGADIKKLADQANDTANQALQNLQNQMLVLQGGQLGFNASILNSISVLKDGKKAFDDHSAAGIADKQAILGSISANLDLYDANINAGKGVDFSTKAYNTNLTALEKQLAKSGELTPAVQKLIDTYLKTPDKVDTEFTNNAPAAKKDVSGYKSEIESVPRSKTFTLHVETTGNLNQAILLARGTGQRVANARGGIYVHAANGILSDASIFSPKAPARYAFAEPSTGGEAFVPRNGEYGRSMSILSAAAGWYGAHVVPSGMSGSQPAQFSLVVTGGDATGKFAVETLRFGIQQRGGDVVKVLSAR